MKTWLKISLGLLAWVGALGSGWSQPPANPALSVTAAIQAIQQAPDPSAVVAAYASAAALARNEPKLHEAYVARMVDMGLPEMAFHQAETVTTLQPDNGLAWGVVAYVNARRGQMADAVAAINLAGQCAPTNGFVARTAGEILAWYDLTADKTNLTDNARSGLTRVRSLVEKNAAFTEAYDTARRAYQAPTNSTAVPIEGASAGMASTGSSAGVSTGSSTNAGPYAPQMVSPTDQPTAVNYVPSDGSAVYAAGYSPSYYGWGSGYAYDWGPSWIAPAPSFWWYPCGFWTGCRFFPFKVSFAFCDRRDVHRFKHRRHFGHFDHRNGFGHRRGFDHHRDPAFWHGDRHGGSRFFGRPARPNATLARWNHQEGLIGRSTAFRPHESTHWRSKAGHNSLTASQSPIFSLAPTFAGDNVSRQQSMWSGRSAGSTRPATVGPTFAGDSARLQESISSGRTAGLTRSATISRPPSTTTPGTRLWSRGTPSHARPGTPSRPPAVTRPSTPSWRSDPAGHARPGAVSRAPAATAPATRSWSGVTRRDPAVSAARPAPAAPVVRAPAYSVPRSVAPAGRSFGVHRPLPSYRGGGGRPVPSVSAPAPRSFGSTISPGRFHGGASRYSFGSGSRGGFSRDQSFGGRGFHGGGPGRGFRGGGHR